MVRWAAFTLLVLGMSSVAQAEVYRWVDENGRVHFSDKSPASEQNSKREDVRDMTTRKTTPTPATASSSRLVLPGLDVNQYSRISSLFRARQFEMLNDELAELTRQVAEDPAREYMLVDAYRAFDVRKPGLELLYDDWVRSYPTLEFPSLARAVYNSGIGWDLYHSGATASGQSRQDQMRQRFFSVLTDADNAVRANSKSAIAYALLVGMARATGDTAQMDIYASAGLKAVPESLYLRTSYMKFLSPAFGGSVSRMQSVASQGASHVRSNRMLGFLPGYLKAYQADEHLRRKEYSAAHALLTQALQLGDNHEFFLRRGEARLALGHFRDALGDFSAAIDMHAGSLEAYLGRARAYGGIRQFRNAAAELRYAMEIDPKRPAVLDYRDRVVSALVTEAVTVSRQGDDRSAMDFLNTAVEIGPQDPDARYERARIHFEHQRFTDAIADATVAVEKGNGVFEHYLLLEDLLARRSFWDDIAGYWGRYIEQRPQDSRGYMARAEALFRSGNVQSAMSDAQTAQSMGHSGASEALRRFKAATAGS